MGGKFLGDWTWGICILEGETGQSIISHLAHGFDSLIDFGDFDSKNPDECGVAGVEAVISFFFLPPRIFFLQVFFKSWMVCGICCSSVVLFANS
jgi:hypothetical protein